MFNWTWTAYINLPINMHILLIQSSPYSVLGTLRSEDGDGSQNIA